MGGVLYKHHEQNGHRSHYPSVEEENYNFRRFEKFMFTQPISNKKAINIEPKNQNFVILCHTKVNHYLFGGKGRQLRPDDMLNKKTESVW